MGKTLSGIVAALGLALAAGCADHTNISAVGENKVLTRPDGCEKVKDIRYQIVPGETYNVYQLLCEQDGGLVLYSRDSTDEEWTSITVE